MVLMNNMLWFYIFIILFGTTSAAWAIDPRDTIPDTTMSTPEVRDHHCVCKKITNSTGKDLFIGWRTLAEWTSFYNSPPTNVTADNCAGIVPSHPTIALPAGYTTSLAENCSMKTATFAINNVQNSGGYTLRVNVPSGLLLSGCSASIFKNDGNGFIVQSLNATNNDVTVCNGSEYYLYFACPAEGTLGPYTVYLRRSDTITIIDSFTIEFFNHGVGACNVMI